MRHPLRFAGLAALLLVPIFASPAFLPAQLAAAPAPQVIALPAPQLTGGMPLMQALNNRKTDRTYADKPLTPQQLSNLLWAAFGVNRVHGPLNKSGRTAPSAHNNQEVDLYVLLAQGTYVYAAEQNQLKPVSAVDLRSKAGTGAAAHAAVTIVFVAPAKDNMAHVDTGFIGQNIYLYAASEGLNAWFYANLGRDLAASLNLSPDRTPLYGQSVGYPEK